MELDSLFLLITIFFISFTFYFSYVFKSKPTKGTLPLALPPGSTGWPIIGETFEYISMLKKDRLDKFVSDRQKKYSSKLFKTSCIGETMVFVCSPEGNKFLFSNDKELVKPWYPKTFDKILGSSDKLRSMTKLEYQSIRKNVVTLFNQPEALRDNVGSVDAIAREHLRKYWDYKDVVEAQPLAKKFTFMLSCRLMLNLQDSETIEEIEKLFTCVMSGLHSLPIDFPGTKFNRGIKASRETRKKFEAVIRQRKMEILEKSIKLANSSNDLLSLLLFEKYKDNREDFVKSDTVESEIAITILGYIIAAYDNSSNTITSIVKFLAELPEVYEEVRREQMEVANSKEPDEALNLEDIKKMRYSWNVVSEVLRLRPPVAQRFREATTDFTFDGFLIPKGWKLNRALHAVLKSAEYFPDPDKFDPSRFEGNKIVPFSYVPFGGGSHKCPGREYARLQILVFMHYLVRKFRWEKMIPDEEIVKDSTLELAKRLPIRLYPIESC